MATITVIDTEQNQEPKKITIATGFPIQLKIEQDGQDAYIDLSETQTRALINALQYALI
jgi:hypothetical protein